MIITDEEASRVQKLARIGEEKSQRSTLYACQILRTVGISYVNTNSSLYHKGLDVNLYSIGEHIR